jgi:alpha/beta superfamily hydrolase
MSIRPFVERQCARRCAATLCSLSAALMTVLASGLALPAHAETQDAAPRRGIGTPPPAAPAPAEPPAAPLAVAPLAPEWVGDWAGIATITSVDRSSSLELRMTIRVAMRGVEPSVTVWCMRAGALGTPAIDLIANGNALAFTLDSQGERARFEGTLGEGGKIASGSVAFVRERRQAPAPSGTWSIRRVDDVATLADARVFSATLEAGGQRLPMRLALGEGPHGWCGTIDILVQGIRDYPVEVARTDTGFTIVLASPAPATITLAATGGPTAFAEIKALEGTFAQGAFAGPIRFEPVAGAKAGTLRRPQQPQPPFPYESTEVTVAHPLGHVLAGTLTMPSKRDLAAEDRVPAIVLVTGSGAQDRDETLMGHKPFAVLADAITRAGVAVLRLDDRGTAKSTGDFAGATTADFASDADIAVEWLKRRPGIDPARIGLLGHSEGGLVGPMVATWQNAGDAPANPLAFLVLIAPPAEIGGRVLTRQTKALVAAAGVSEVKLAPMIAAHEALMTEMISARPADALRPFVASLVREQLILAGQPMPDENTLRALSDQTLAQLTGPWMSEFIRLDPRAALLWLEVPALAVWGSLDLQVESTSNSAIFDEVAKSTGAPITTRVFEGLNHLLQPAKTGTVEEYGEIETTIDPKALEEIVGWIVATARRGPAKQVPESTRPVEIREAYVAPRLFYHREQPPAEAAPASTEGARAP